jgi:hypothetical protein
MAILAQLTAGAVVTDTGTEVVNRLGTLADYGVDDYQERGLSLPPGGALEIDLTEVASGLSHWEAMVSLMLNLKAPAMVSVLLTKAGAEEFQINSAPFVLGRTELTYLRITNTGGVPAQGSLIMLGRLN